ncbi:hypothetical protein PAPYR_9163 [Paratrimastix pyriformis]|uniref:F5/8 type C domain-containing protein n=1 Tax=Paratrimastix pyriformis TaxID=342808 RepID=A0ABQ8U904_9EUKA|nr:hypothetical protein PAPYR_9163 [Paratrimastix pyriformis]
MVEALSHIDLQAQLAQAKTLLRQKAQELAKINIALAYTQGELAQTQERACELAQTKTELLTQRICGGSGQTKTQLRRCELEQARATDRMQHELVTIREQIGQLFIVPPAAPEGLAARWDEATKEVVLDWQPVPGIPRVRYRVQSTLLAGYGAGSGSPVVVYTGPECCCRYRFPLDVAEARFVVVAMRGLAESSPSAPAICTRPYRPTLPAPADMSFPFPSTPAWVSALTSHSFPPSPPPSPGPVATVVFQYDHNTDDRGLFYYIGTQGRTQPWQNPAEAGLVTVTRSSDHCGKASDALGRQPCSSWTSDRPKPSWWQVDLGAGRLFTPTRYTIRQDINPGATEFRLQSWRLEGWDGRAKWRTLDGHTNEHLPARVDAAATFAVDPERAFPARHFRVLMTGPSPNGERYLLLSGFEMYGTLHLDHHAIEGGAAEDGAAEKADDPWPALKPAVVHRRE